jgi:hypothetical protein
LFFLDKLIVFDGIHPKLIVFDRQINRFDGVHPKFEFRILSHLGGGLRQRLPVDLLASAEFFAETRKNCSRKLLQK